MDFLTRKLQTSYKELTTPCRQQYIVDKRWITILFYALKGERKSTIAKLLKIDINSVDNAIERAKPEIRLRARNLYNIYNGLPEIEENRYSILVPDYKHSKVVREWI